MRMYRKIVQNNTMVRLGFTITFTVVRQVDTRANKYINEFIYPRPPHSTRIYIAFTVHWFHHDRFLVASQVRNCRSFIGFVRPEKRYHCNALWFPSDSAIGARPGLSTIRKKIGIVGRVWKNILIAAYK